MELLEELRELKAPNAVMETFDSFARAYGAISSCYAYLDVDGKKHAWSSTSADFRELYSAHEFDKADPEFRKDTRPFSSVGFRLSNGFPGLEGDREANRLYEEARAFGYTGELFVPDQSPEGLREFATINIITNIPYRRVANWMDSEGATLRLAAVSVLARMRDIRRNDAAPAFELSPREIEVLRLLSRGYRVAAIAGELDLSTKTVDFHISNARHRMKAKTRDHAVAIALSNGLLHPRSI